MGDFDADHGPTLRIAEYNGLLDGLQGYGPDWDPWAGATRGEAAQILANFMDPPGPGATTTLPTTTTTRATTTTRPSTTTTTAGEGPTVYVTDTGSKYHRDGCRYLSKSRIPISLGDAKAQGYGPCSVCKPPD
jgi:hypothetical protein